jgi:hypothetical protein
MMEPRVVVVFLFENIFKDLGGYGMFCHILLYLDILYSERLYQLKRQVNIAFVILNIIIKGFNLHILSHCLLYIIFYTYYLYITWCVFHF